MNKKELLKQLEYLEKFKELLIDLPKKSIFSL